MEQGTRRWRAASASRKCTPGSDAIERKVHKTWTRQGDVKFDAIVNSEEGLQEEMFARDGGRFRSSAFGWRKDAELERC